MLTGKHSKFPRQFSEADLDAIPALPHADPDRLFVMDLQGRRYGGMSALYLCAGVLTSMVMDVTEGMHLKAALVLERIPRRRAQAERGLRQLYLHYPERVPQRAIDRAFTWADSIDHDGYMVDGSLFKELGADCELLVHLEAGCQGHSALALLQAQEWGAQEWVQPPRIWLAGPDGSSFGRQTFR